ncbi:MAG: trimethylamine methyltransferase family protein [Anaerolineae bacterium]
MGHVRSHVEVLTRSEIGRIHRASLQVLAEVGVRVPNETLLGRLRAAGASVSGDTVRLPEPLIERMLAESIGTKRPRRPRRPQPVTVCNGCETSILTYPEHERRPGTIEDVVKGIVITNALPTVASALPVVVPADVPLPLAPIAAYRLGCLYSTKPYNVYFGRGECPHLMEMAAVVAEETGRDRGSLGFGFGFGIISPLRFSADDLDTALLMAESGWPAGCYSFVTIGASSPASMAGSLVLSNAERLACLTLMWQWRQLGGYRKDFVEDPCIIEPHTLATSFAHPNLTTIAIATGQLSRFYGLGHGGGGLALSDAKWIDYQDGFERGMGAAFLILAGGGIGNSGIVGADETISLEQLVLDDASLAQVNWIRRGIDVSDDSLALDVIREVGIAGTYLDQEHTVRHLRREYWESPLFPRPSWSDWERAGREALMERAHKEVERILAAGFPPKRLLPDTAVKRLDAIVERAKERT